MIVIDGQDREDMIRMVIGWIKKFKIADEIYAILNKDRNGK